MGSHRSSKSWQYATFMLPFALLPVIAQADTQREHQGSEGAEKDGQQHWSLIGLEHKRRIFFKYEKRIRNNSSLEKVFDYFSTLAEHGGHKYMTPMDLLSAIVPTYPPSQSLQERSGSLDGEPRPHMPASHHRLQAASESVFRQFDVDGDGKLSFWEYRLVRTLLAIPEADAAIIFNAVDLDGSGSVDAGEFQEVLRLLQRGGPGGHHHQHGSSKGGNRVTDARGVYKQQEVASSGLMVSFFGPDQKGKLGLKQFMSFLDKLHTEVTVLEFMFYDVEGKGNIPGVDFARSLVAAAEMKDVDSFMDKVDALPPELRDARVSQQDFCAMVGLARKSHSLEVALGFYAQVGRSVSKADLDKMLRKLCDVNLSPTVLDLVMALFSDAEGNLDIHTFLGMLHCRAQLWHSRGHQESLPQGLSKWWYCLKQCTSVEDE